MTIKEIAEQEKVSTNYIGKVLKLRFLSPRIQKMILLGEQSEKLISYNLRMVASMEFQRTGGTAGIIVYQQNQKSTITSNLASNSGKVK